MAPDLIEELRALLVRTLRLARDAQSIDADAPLFGGELGLDSLDAVQILSAIERHFAVRVSDADLARYSLSTLAGLAQLVRDKTGR